jgi:hypothetical protein
MGRIEMPNSEETARVRTLRVTLDIDIEELPPEQHQSIFGIAKDIGMSVPDYAATALKTPSDSDVALCVRSALRNPAMFDGSSLDVKAGDVRIVKTEWRPPPLPAPASPSGRNRHKQRQDTRLDSARKTNKCNACDRRVRYFRIFGLPGIRHTADQDVRELAQTIYDGPNTTRLMEVYSMEMDIEAQLQGPIAIHF